MTTNVQESAQGNRSIQRRNEDELIQGLEAKIREVEERMKRREIKASPLHKDFERFKKHVAKFVQACADEGRQDMANTLLGAMTVTESQVKALD